MAGYQKNTWVLYNKDIPKYEQPDAFITKSKLENIENGIENAVTDFKIGTVSKGTEVYCEIIADENDPSVKRINMVIPKEVSWSFSNVELVDKSAAPNGATLNDIILDAKGNIFTVIENGNGVYVLNERLNIRGGIGETGPQGKPGVDGKPGQDGKDGQDGNKWLYIERNVFEGEEAPENANSGDFVFDTKFDVFPVLDNLTLGTKLFNLRGPQGEQGLKGDGGLSTYDVWKSLGYEGNAEDFLKSLRGDIGPAAIVVDSLDSTSTTEALSANMGRELKNNRLTTLEDIMANEEEGIFVDALVVKELYLKMKEMIENMK